jgi:hypothetical protein
MSESEKLSAIPEAHRNARPAEYGMEAPQHASTKEETASDVEMFAQPKQRETIPQSQRRGMLAGISIVPEIANAFEYSNGKKWLFTAIVALAGTTSSTGSSILYRKYPKLQKMHEFLADQVD